MFCTKCGKEIADDSRFCTACGCSISNVAATPIPAQQSPAGKAVRKIRTSWIVIGIIVIILVIALAVDRNSPENVAVRQKESQVTEAPSNEKPVTWGDVKKSWAEAKKAKQDLDKSVDDLKNEWNGLKQQVKDAVNDKEVRAATDEFKRAVKETTESVKTSLTEKELKDAQNDLKAALED